MLYAGITLRITVLEKYHFFYGKILIIGQSAGNKRKIKIINMISPFFIKFSMDPQRLYAKQLKNFKTQLQMYTNKFEQSLFFNFIQYEKNLPQHKTHIDRSFLEWFIGFTEGDGSFLISPSQDSKDSPEPLRLFFIITQKEVQVLHKIRSSLGFGKVSAHGDYFRYIVADLKSVDRLIHLFNGNLLLKKTNIRFANWVQARNIISSRKLNPPIDLLPPLFLRIQSHEVQGQIFSPLRNSGWLSGLIDAEGCFNISKIKNVKHSCGFRIRCRLLIDQKDEQEIFQNILTEIQGGFIHERTGESEKMYRLEWSSFKDLNTFKEYFKKYPLKSRKRFACMRLYKMLFYLENRETLPWTGKVLKRIHHLVSKQQTENINETSQYTQFSEKEDGDEK